MATSDYPREYSSQRSIISEKQFSPNAPNFPGEREAGKNGNVEVETKTKVPGRI